MMIERTLSIARVTFVELIRNKLLFLFLFFSLAVVAISTLYGSVAVGDQAKVTKDIGITSISLFNVLFMVLSGASLLQKELSKKTIYNLLSKPLHRGEFLVGKFLGIAGVSIILIIGMAIGLIGYVAFYSGTAPYELLQACFFVFLEGLIVSAAAIFFSSIVVTPLLSGLFTFFFFVAGRSAEYLLSFSKLTGATAVEYLYWVLPHLNILFTGNEIVYGVTRSAENVCFAILYACGYATVLLVIAMVFFERRHFN